MHYPEEAEQPGQPLNDRSFAEDASAEHFSGEGAQGRKQGQDPLDHIVNDNNSLDKSPNQ